MAQPGAATPSEQQASAHAAPTMQPARPGTSAPWESPEAAQVKELEEENERLKQEAEDLKKEKELAKEREELEKEIEKLKEDMPEKGQREK